MPVGKLRIEERRAGKALVRDGRMAPLGYLRGDRLRMKCGDDYEEFSAEDLEGIAQRLRELGGRKLHKIEKHVLPSAA